MREYTPEILHKVQQCELSILKDFVRICIDNNISFFGFGGTAIGALRHGGFIPWDDDIDIAVIRSDMDRIVKIIKRDYSDKYHIVDASLYDDFPLMTTHIVLNGSIFVSDSLPGLDCPLGIFLDIFPLDVVAPEGKARRRQYRRAYLLCKLMILSKVPRPVVMGSKVKKFFVHFITCIVNFFMRLLRINKKKIYSKLLTVCTEYNNTENPELYGYFCDTFPDRNNFTPDMLFPVRKIKFEDIEDMEFPNKIEQQLEGYYGDYMQLPPVEKRKNHFPSILKFPGEDMIYRNE